MTRFATLVASAPLLTGGATGGLTGCASGGGTGGPVVSPPTAADALVLRLTELPGLLPPGGAAAQPPTFSLYGGGRLIAAPAAPNGVWPMLAEHQVTAEQMSGLLSAAASTGVLNDITGSGAGPDAPVVIITLVSGGTAHTATLPKSDGKVAALRSELSRQAAGTGVPYQPATVAVIAFPTGTTAAQRQWPLGSLTGQPLTGLNAGAFCTLLRGRDIETARAAAASASPPTTWNSDDKAWTVAFRPFLPDESACPT